MDSAFEELRGQGTAFIDISAGGQVLPDFAHIDMAHVNPDDLRPKQTPFRGKDGLGEYANVTYFSGAWSSVKLRKFGSDWVVVDVVSNGTT